MRRVSRKAFRLLAKRVSGRVCVGIDAQGFEAGAKCCAVRVPAIMSASISPALFAWLARRSLTIYGALTIGGLLSIQIIRALCGVGDDGNGEAAAHGCSTGAQRAAPETVS